MPYFKFITKYNLYKDIIENFSGRNNSNFTGIGIFASNNSGYLLNISGGILTLNLKFLSPESDYIKIFIPTIIFKTGNSIESGDNIFNKLNISLDFHGYYQYITGGNDYIPVGEEIINGNSENQFIYLGYLYNYCHLANEKWKDSYFFDRYQYNLSTDKEDETKVDNTYVCNNDRTLTGSICVTPLGPCYDYTGCSCEQYHDYWICKDVTNPLNKTCDTTTAPSCLDYITGTINLNTTNCNFSGLLNTGPNAKYFLLR